MNMTNEDIKKARIKHIQRLLDNELVEPEMKMTDCSFTHDAQMKRYKTYVLLKQIQKNNNK